MWVPFLVAIVLICEHKHLVSSYIGPFRTFLLFFRSWGLRVGDVSPLCVLFRVSTVVLTALAHLS